MAKKRFDKIINDIKEIKVQGADTVTKAGIKAFLLQPDKKSAKKILSVRPTEPMLQFAIKRLLKSKKPKKEAKKILKFLEKSKKKIAKKGARLIKNNMTIFVHCHSTTVLAILKEAKKRKKKFTVFTTETDPLLQGRKTARELAKQGITVIHVPDTAVEYSLTKSDIFLFGADALTKKGIYNKIGTSMYSKVASLHKTKCYCAASVLKFSKKKPKIEFRPGKEVWLERIKKIVVLNPAFDFTNKKYIKAIISEFGITSYKEFLRKIKKFKL